MSGVNARIATTKHFTNRSCAARSAAACQSRYAGHVRLTQQRALSQRMGKVLPTSNGKDFGPVIIGMVGEVGSDRLHEAQERFMIVGWIVRQECQIGVDHKDRV